MVNAQGWSGLPWVSVGFVIGLLVTARIAFPILLGLPRAIRLVGSGEMRAAVYRRLLFTPVLWVVTLAVTVFLVEFFWPSAAAWFESNGAFECWPVARRCGYPAVSALYEVSCRLRRRL